MASLKPSSADLGAAANADTVESCVQEEKFHLLKRDRQPFADSFIVSGDAKRQRTVFVGHDSSSVTGTVVTHESSDELYKHTAESLHPRGRTKDSDVESGCEFSKGNNDSNGSSPERKGKHNDETLACDVESNGGSVVTNDVPFEVNVCHSPLKDDTGSASNQRAGDKLSSSEVENDNHEESNEKYESNYGSECDSEGDQTVPSQCPQENSVHVNDSNCHGDEQPKLHLNRPPAHDLFLPSEWAPTYEDLQYRLDDEGDGFMMSYGPILPYHLNSSSSSVTDSSTVSSSVSSNNSKSSTKIPNKSDKKKRVSFNDSITVRPIYQISMYSPSMIEGMYTNHFELQANRRRNYEEYLYENKNWLEVVEEHEMIRDGNTGELIHPAHSHFIHADFLGRDEVSAANLPVGPDSGLDLSSMLNFWN